MIFFFSSLDLRTSPCITVTNKHISNDMPVYVSVGSFLEAGSESELRRLAI